MLNLCLLDGIAATKIEMDLFLWRHIGSYRTGSQLESEQAIIIRVHQFVGQ
jgi:hypothetical protein